MTNTTADLAGRPVIVGGGLAGLVAALALAPRPVVVLTKTPLGRDVASAWAQGGVAAAVMPDDSPAQHALDTVNAGDGINDTRTVDHMTEAGPEIIAWLESQGVHFTRDAQGNFVCKLEAAHTRRRVLNAGGDGTGAEIMRAIIATVRNNSSITVIETASALALLTDVNGIAGISAQGPEGRFDLSTRQVVLATGGCAGLWLDTTNPLGSIGQGLAMAAKAGAQLVDLEFVQFHPTAIDIGLDPMPLASEALRGDGAILINDAGERFMTAYARAELEPRDIVARAVWAQIRAGRRVFLDTREAMGAAFLQRFPTITAICRQAGIDPTTQAIPIKPAAHYHMGGIAVDHSGRTSVPGLWACGETASTGLHGANRLASNSLLEAVVTGRDVAADIAGSIAPPWASVVPEIKRSGPPARGTLHDIRRIMTTKVGVLRERYGLTEAVQKLNPMAAGGGAAELPAIAALLIATAALQRQESRGGHFRTDFPSPDPAQAIRRFTTLDDVVSLAQALSLEEAS